MLIIAGNPLSDAAAGELADLVRAAGADHIADKLDRAVADQERVVDLTGPERGVIFAVLEDPPDNLAGVRMVLSGEHQYRQSEGLDWGDPL